MKPSVFIGSSVEGIKIAYAIQQNLRHDAECTVWDQGVFELSSTAIESLSEHLEKMDFGIFVFSPDDITKIRNRSNKTVRDNVIFEIGLFIGKLGRKRVFFITPDNQEIKIPSDLLGVTPAKYEVGRKDGSDQAATGAACSEIKIQMSKLGPLHTDIAESEPSDDSKKESSRTVWLEHLVNDELETARDHLLEEIESKLPTEEKEDQIWLKFIEAKINKNDTAKELLKLAQENASDAKISTLLGRLLDIEGFTAHAIAVAENAYENTNYDYKVAILLSELYNRSDRKDDSIKILESQDPKNNPKIALELSALLDDDPNKQLSILVECYRSHANNRQLTFALARQFQERDQDEEALYLLKKLTREHPENSEYWGYLSNSCLNLELYENAMENAKEADGLTDSSEAWIINNIGNMLNNRGFHSEGIRWLKRGLELEPNSQYAHDRVARAMASIEKENQKFNEHRLNGEKLILKLQL